jgi:hypothetical protein
MDDQGRMQCFCSYKCSNFPPGYAWVKKRTWYFHEKKIVAGEVHHTVKRLSRLNNPLVMNLVATEDVPSTSSGHVISQEARGRGSHLIRCLCHVCKGNFMWSQATVNMHFGYNVMGNQSMSVAPLMESPMFEDPAQEVDKSDTCTSNIAASTFC